VGRGGEERREGRRGEGTLFRLAVGRREGGG
jgi:hypothetical protein